MVYDEKGKQSTLEQGRKSTLAVVLCLKRIAEAQNKTSKNKSGRPDI